VTSAQAAAFHSLSRLIDEFVQGTTGVSHAVVVSTKGVLRCRSRGLPEEPAQELTVLTADLLGRGQDATRLFGAGAVRKARVEMTKCSLFVASIGDSLWLAAVMDNDCDFDVVDGEVTRLFGPLRRQSTPRRRAALPSP
jgi:predicted regulator of Ras-like GTPase activity (Roadblock/LC7/MglB family)